VNVGHGEGDASSGEVKLARVIQTVAALVAKVPPKQRKEAIGEHLTTLVIQLSASTCNAEFLEFIQPVYRLTPWIQKVALAAKDATRRSHTSTICRRRRRVRRFGLSNLNPVNPQLESAWFQSLNLLREKLLLSLLVFKFKL
jgi:hypothetical protein